jgi:hypothetical protein
MNMNITRTTAVPAWLRWARPMMVWLVRREIHSAEHYAEILSRDVVRLRQHLNTLRAKLIAWEAVK